MRGQVIRGGQANNPGDMPLQLRRFAERQASVFQRLRPREQGFAIVGQAVAALMAAEERNVQRLLQPIQPAGDRGNPHVHLVGGAAQRSHPAMARNMRASSQWNSAVIYFPCMENGSPFSALFYQFRRDDTARHSRRQTGHPIACALLT